MFTPVKVVRASEDVVEQIRKAIFSGKLSPGDRLPPERELVQEFGLSRVTIREAIRTLEASGIIQVKTGASGGSFVAEVTSKIVTDSLRTLLRLKKTTFQELAEARKVIETAIAEMAALRADENDIAAMQMAIDHQRDAVARSAPFGPSVVEFHTAMAAAAKNRVLLSTVNSFRDPLNEALSELGFFPEAPLESLEHHEKILSAVRSHDSLEARRLTEADLQNFEDKVRLMSEAVTNGSELDTHG